MIGILGIVVIIVATVMAYRTAKQYDRNAVAWAAIVLAVGFGIQLIIPLLLGVVIAVVMLVNGNTETEIQSAIALPSIIIGLVCIVLSVVAVMLILRYLSKIPEDKPFTQPPTPPTFN